MKNEHSVLMFGKWVVNHQINPWLCRCSQIDILDYKYFKKSLTLLNCQVAPDIWTVTIN